MYRSFLGLLIFSFTLQAGLLPTIPLDQNAVHFFDKYVARYEASPNMAFSKSGVMWIDTQSDAHKKEHAAGKPFTEIMTGENVPGGHIHHLFGAVHIPGASIADFVATMQNYGRYPEYFKPDIAKGASKAESDSSPSLQHFEVSLEMVHSTAWMDIAFDTGYDTRYEFLSGRRVSASSRSVYIREHRDPHNPAEGTYPEGMDHGFLWRTYTSWHARERNGGLDLELNSISLCRPVPLGAGWWANRTARSTAEKMIHNTAVAIRNNLAANSSSKQAETKPGF